MAFSSLLTLLDDITAVLDDVSIMSKVAAKKTAGVIGDDLALNANQVSGKDIRPERELPIVWAVAKGSLINKIILIPLALLLSIYLPQAITVLLLLGGAYLCFEGAEKVLHSLFHRKSSEHHEAVSEASKIKGAIRTDFILSAEIIIIVLGTVQDSSTLTKILTLSAIGFGITIFVYGLVGLIVKLDDIGLWMLEKKNALAKMVGNSIIFLMPWLMRSLSILGTIAMFMVGGGIFSHNLPFVHHFIEQLNLSPLLFSLSDFIVGALVGLLLCLISLPILRLLKK
ncbi:inner membrane protein YedI [Haemophilus sputorum HK 2154]|uniref:DUF808 domain-containing protein n=1 Tax=Haemophilus sputorum TaxID=1078480 RepID=UPI000248A4DF|nr:DUF808 domain-containing protein [Haemophilus sputorum]EJP29650.1 inner membrane protein YedI [Haemophilus sputorum HK 2154]